LLHGGLSTIDTSFGKILPSLARTRQVIAIELQGHGHTAGLDRPMSFETMADDVASLLGQLAVERADVLGYSFGGVVALGIAIRHPHQVGHLILIGTPNGNDGFEPIIRDSIKGATPRDVPKPLKEAYERSAPDVRQFPLLVAKVSKLLTDFPGWRQEDLHSIGSPTLIIVGDHDFIRPEHAIQVFRLIPGAQLAILPGAGHDAITERHEDVLAIATRFLDGAPGQ
jgi:pimeloyl-ACP methyl ester carboxylesterase